MNKLRLWLKTQSFLPWIGFTCTFGYFGLIIQIYNERLLELQFMPLNEVGDFLAGAFGPVAFLWLIIGYLMQSKELSNNTSEYKKSLDLARDQLAFQKKLKNEENINNFNLSQPHFSITADYILPESVARLYIVNSGSKITSFQIYLPNKDNSTDAIFGYNLPINIVDETKTQEIELEICRENFISPDHGIIAYPVSFYDGQRNLQKTQLRIGFQKSDKGWKVGCFIDTTRRPVQYAY